ncbi:MAG: hypothetical protein NC489_26355 [Ruminococcus flavefaciens]|nr:hypothetical protein [Ruminococcus flavefaciens]
MNLNKILKSFKWFKNHLTYILIVVYFVLLFALSFFDYLCIDFNFNKLLKDNEAIINFLIGSLGIGGAIVLYSEYFTKKQHEAVFGFYANMRVFLKRLNVFLDDNFSQSIIMVKLYTKSALASYSSNIPSKEYLSAFQDLCREFLSFLSVSKDNIPAKRGSEDFINWFNSQINIVELLQKGALFTVNYYGDYSNKDELEKYYNQIKRDVTYINSVIKMKIEEDSFKS